VAIGSSTAALLVLVVLVVSRSGQRLRNRRGSAAAGVGPGAHPRTGSTGAATRGGRRQTTLSLPFLLLCPIHLQFRDCSLSRRLSVARDSRGSLANRTLARAKGCKGGYRGCIGDVNKLRRFIQRRSLMTNRDGIVAVGERTSDRAATFLAPAKR